MWHAFVWIGTIIFLVWLAYQFVPGLHEFIHQFQTGWAERDRVRRFLTRREACARIGPARRMPACPIPQISIGVNC